MPDVAPPSPRSPVSFDPTPAPAADPWGIADASVFDRPEADAPWTPDLPVAPTPTVEVFDQETAITAPTPAVVEHRAPPDPSPIPHPPPPTQAFSDGPPVGDAMTPGSPAEPTATSVTPRPPAVPTTIASSVMLGQLGGLELDQVAVTVNDEHIGKLEPGFGRAERSRSLLILVLLTLLVATIVGAVLAISIELISVWANHAISKSAGA
ncbi:MAG: hypothetical protein ACYDH6_20760 [Acidimicrobiales bacterium]